MNSHSIFESALSREFNGSIQAMLQSGRFGRFLMQLSIDGFDIHRNLSFIEKMYVEEMSELGRGLDLKDSLFFALRDLSNNTETLDFAVDYCHRTKTLKSWGWLGCPLNSAPRCPARKLDGSLRAPEEMGLQSGGEKLIGVLLDRALVHKDTECLIYLRSFPAGTKLITDRFLDHKIRELAQKKGGEDLISFFDEFVLKESSEDMTLSRYWEILHRDSVFISNASTALLKENYHSNLVKKLPDAFIERLMGFENIFKATVDKFILLMIDDGIDCYPGFLRGYGGAFFQFDHGHKPKNYQWLIDVCLKNLKLPGYEAMLNSIPLDEILKLKKPDMVLDLIHLMTGRQDVVALMSHVAKGKALQRDLGM